MGFGQKGVFQVWGTVEKSSTTPAPTTQNVILQNGLPTLSSAATPLGAWLRGLLGRAHKNTVVVALAAKLAVIRRGISLLDADRGALSGAD